MAADVVVSRELKSLQDELSSARRERLAASAMPTGAACAEPVKESADERELRDQLRELVDEATSFFAEAEKNISAHPLSLRA